MVANGLQVIRVDALPVETNVVNVVIISDGSNIGFVHEPVRQAVSPPVVVELPVPV